MGEIIFVLLILWLIGYFIFNITIPFIIANSTWFIIIGIILLIVVLVYLYNKVFMPIVKNNRRLKDERIAREDEEEHQRILRSNWSETGYSKLYGIYISLEDEILPRILELKEKYANNLKRKEKYDNYAKSAVPANNKGAQRELKDINDALERRKNAIKIYENSLEAIKFQKDRIDDRKEDFFSGINLISAEEDYKEALHFGQQVAKECIDVDLDLQDLHLNNIQGADDYYQSEPDGVLKLVNKLSILKIKGPDKEI